jgi:hypothetical protein
MKKLSQTKVYFTDNGRQIASDVIKKLPTELDVDYFIEQLEDEFKGIESRDHQMMTAADVIRVAEYNHYEL